MKRKPNWAKMPTPSPQVAKVMWRELEKTTKLIRKRVERNR